MNAPSIAQSEESESFLTRLWARLALSRFFTFSLLLHVILVLLAGTAVIFRTAATPPDFSAGEGIVADSAESTAPPEEHSQPSPDTAPAPPTASTPALALTVLTMNAPSSFVINSAPMETKGVGPNLDSQIAKAVDKAGAAAAAAMGVAGGTRKTAMIFNKKIEAGKLGVILDVSASGHPHLASAIKEIDKGFNDAVIVLYPGCGMTEEPKGKPLHEVRKLSSIPKKEFPDDALNFSTPGQLNKAFKIEEFEKLTKRPNIRERLFVSWFAGDDPNNHSGLTDHTDIVFDYLVKQGVDTIYWFSDFEDQVKPDVCKAVLKLMEQKKIKVYLNNFAGKEIPKTTMELAEKTGGTVDIDKPDKPK